MTYSFQICCQRFVDEVQHSSDGVKMGRINKDAKLLWMGSAQHRSSRLFSVAFAASQQAPISRGRAPLCPVLINYGQSAAMSWLGHQRSTPAPPTALSAAALVLLGAAAVALAGAALATNHVDVPAARVDQTLVPAKHSSTAAAATSTWCCRLKAACQAGQRRSQQAV